MENFKALFAQYILFVMTRFKITNGAKNTLEVDYTFKDDEFVLPFQFLSSFDKLFEVKHGQTVYNKSFDFIF